MASSVITPSIIILSIVCSVVLCDPEYSYVEFVNETVSSHPIVIFSKSDCPFCSNAKDVFKELNAEPHVIELNTMVDGSEIQSAMTEVLGRRTVPQVFVNGKHIGGATETIASYKSGELAMLISIDSNVADILELEEL